MIFNKNNSIKKTTIMIFSIMYSIFFILTSINLYFYSYYEFKKTEKLINNSNLNLSQQITEKIDNILNVSKYPLIIPETDKLNSILSNISYSINDYNYLSNICEMMLIQNTSINGVFIYNLKGNGVVSSRNSNNDKLKNPSTEDWFLNSIQSDMLTSLHSDISSNNIFDIQKYSDDKLIGVTRKILNVKTQEITGLILITFPSDDFLNIETLDLPFDKQILSLYNLDENLIVSTKDSYNETIDESPISKDSDDINYIFTYSNIPTTDWTLVNAIPKSQVYNISLLYIIFFIINILFCLVLFIILYVLFIKRIFRPLESLILNMDNNIENNLNHTFDYFSNDEMGILAKSYNSMKSRINNLINTNYKNQIEQKDLELTQLQHQINPHFIYNTLESIHMMAEINSDLETSIMAEYFGSIIRYSMNRKVNTVLLKDELDIIHNYIYLQKVRFDQLFTIENLINDNVLNCVIEKMIIQPLIENSIYHGLSECSSNGKIIIQGERLNNNLVLIVSDNGKGIDDTKLKDLNDYINDKNNLFKGIALRNINRRLKLNYGDEYGLEIFSVYGNGTSMTITLPYILK